MTDETTPDAVEARDPLDGLEQFRRIIDKQPEPAPESVMLGLDYCYAEWVAERARHAEEVARLRDVHLDETRALDDLRLKEIASLRDQLRKVEGERAMWEKTASVLSGKLDSLRSLLPDVRACAEHCISCSRSGEATTEAARRILAALDSHECSECHRNSDHKMSCSRGGSKGGRFGVSLDSQGGEGE